MAFRDEVAACDEFPETELERTGLATGELDELAEGEGFVIWEKGDYFLREWWKNSWHGSLERFPTGGEDSNS